MTREEAIAALREASADARDLEAHSVADALRDVIVYLEGAAPPLPAPASECHDPSCGTDETVCWCASAKGEPRPPLPALTPEDEAVLTEVAEVLEGEGIYANLLGRVRSLLGRVQAKEPR